MTVSLKHKLEPAHSIIERLGGAKEVARICGVTTGRVHRWRSPKTEHGGTNGRIPTEHMLKLMAHAKANDIRLEYEDFFGDELVA